MENDLPKVCTFNNQRIYKPRYCISKIHSVPIEITYKFREVCEQGNTGNVSHICVTNLYS